MPSINDLEKMRDSFRAASNVSLTDVLRQLGDPADEAIVDFAVEQMSCSDRNIRVLALRRAT